MGDIAQGQQVSKKLPAKQLIPYVLLVVGAVAMAVSFFLPFASAKGDYAEYLKQYGDRVYTAEAGLHNKDVVGLSLLTFLRIYIAGLQSGKLLGGMYLEAVICITLMAVIAVSSAAYSAVRSVEEAGRGHRILGACCSRFLCTALGF